MSIKGGLGRLNGVFSVPLPGLLNRFAPMMNDDGAEVKSSTEDSQEGGQGEAGPDRDKEIPLRAGSPLDAICSRGIRKIIIVWTICGPEVFGHGTRCKSGAVPPL